jgi:lipoyl(octanoyl) transferase
VLSEPGRTLLVMSGLRFTRVGFGADLVEYERAWAIQRELHARVVAGEAPDTVLLLEHPPVYTAGRRTHPTDRPFDGTPVIDVDRGGRITWHGPGQIVGYPIVRLASPVDVVAYVRRLEEALIHVCADLGVTAGRVEGRSGVWIRPDPTAAPQLGGGRRERKVAAIGVRVAQGVTMHGFALNCDPDLSWFSRIVPCGIPDADVTSLSVELRRDVTVAEVLPLVERHVDAVDLPGRVAAAEPLTAAAASPGQR